MLAYFNGNNQLSVGDGTITGAINELNMGFVVAMASRPEGGYVISCLLYTSDAADER